MSPYMSECSREQVAVFAYESDRISECIVQRGEGTHSPGGVVNAGSQSDHCPSQYFSVCGT